MLKKLAIFFRTTMWSTMSLGVYSDMMTRIDFSHQQRGLITIIWLHQEIPTIIPASRQS